MRTKPCRQSHSTRLKVDPEADSMERNREHLLKEVLLIAIATLLSGAERCNDIADYGEAKVECLRRSFQGINASVMGARRVA
jgi:hypothetical protein